MTLKAKPQFIHTADATREPLSIGIALINAAEFVTGIGIGYGSAGLIGTVCSGGHLAGVTYDRR